jgi:hypothetical protein
VALTVNVRLVEGEFRLSCQSMDFEAISQVQAKYLADDDPLDRLNGFEGTARQLQQLTSLVGRDTTPSHARTFCIEQSAMIGDSITEQPFPIGNWFHSYPREFT